MVNCKTVIYIKDSSVISNLHTLIYFPVLLGFTDKQSNLYDNPLKHHHFLPPATLPSFPISPSKLPKLIVFLPSSGSSLPPWIPPLPKIINFCLYRKYSLSLPSLIHVLLSLQKDFPTLSSLPAIPYLELNNAKQKNGLLFLSHANFMNNMMMKN